MTCTVYELYDETTEKVYYVGRTKQDIEKRFYQHVYKEKKEIEKLNEELKKLEKKLKEGDDVADKINELKQAIEKLEKKGKHTLACRAAKIDGVELKSLKYTQSRGLEQIAHDRAERELPEGEELLNKIRPLNLSATKKSVKNKVNTYLLAAEKFINKSI